MFKDFSKGTSAFLITVIQVSDGSFGKFDVITPFPFNSSIFKVLNNSVLIGGYYNSRPLVLHFDLSSKQSKIIPGFFNDPGEITQILTHPDGAFEVLISSKNKDRKKAVWIRRYSNEGDLLSTTILHPKDNLNFIYGVSSRLSDGTQIVSGMYGRNKEYSRGVFISKILDEDTHETSYYSFADLNRFFNYMKAKKEARIKGRIARRKVKGKKVRLSYKLMIHDLIPDKDQYILVGEAYYPHYTTYTGSTQFISTTYVPGSRMVFDGYIYTHAVVIGISKNGKLLWDNSFEINDIKTFNLQQYVNIKPEKDKVFLFYIHNNIIRTKIIQNQDIIENKSYEAIKLKYPEDQIVTQISELNKLDHWHGEYFYAYGVQQVQNLSEANVDIVRKVFFINKITYK
ncbi:MAG: hypothetical protein HC811_04515 [Flammeovirgaceae bacterium]|nr:hypothetical protein [Flammeovirgaceae bacterium]